MTPPDILGTIGVTLLLFAFIMQLMNKWKTDDWYYLVLNFAGAALACLSSWLIHFHPFIVLDGQYHLSLGE